MAPEITRIKKVGAIMLSMIESEYRATQSADTAAPGTTHERILRVLGMTQRPLKSGELEMALGLVASEARTACQWLDDNGYIECTVRVGKAAAAHRAMMFWSLADKGRLWAKDQGALVA
jgi:hypothetical protein